MDGGHIVLKMLLYTILTQISTGAYSITAIWGLKLEKNCITSLEQIKVYKDPILFELFSGEPFLVRLNLENSGASGKDFLSYAPLVGYSAVLIDLNVWWDQDDKHKITKSRNIQNIQISLLDLTNT